MLTGLAGLSAVLVRSWAANVVGVAAIATAAVTLGALLRRDWRRRAFLRFGLVDISARYGGEEFVFLLPETDLEGPARWPNACARW